MWVNQGSKRGRKYPLDPCQRISLSATSGAGEAGLALGIFSTRLHFDALAARSGKGRSRQKREKKRKGFHPEKNQECLSLPPLPCIHWRQLFIISFFPQGYKCWHLWGNNPIQGFVSYWKFFSEFSFWPFLFFRHCMFFIWENRGKMQPKQHFSFSGKVSILIYWKLVQPVIYILSVKDSKNFQPKQIFPWKRPSLMRCRSSDVSAEEFCQFRQKKKRVGDRTKTKLPGKHAMLQVNGLKCQLVNCHKAREVNQSTRVNGAMLIYTEDLALDFNRTSLASCFSAYPSSSLFNKLSVILGLSFNNSPFSLHDPSFLSGDNGMGFSARSPHRNIVDRLNSAQLATAF